MTSYALVTDGDKVVPVAHLDNVLVLRDSVVQKTVLFYDQVNGEASETDVAQGAYNVKMRQRTLVQLYDTTDHKPMSVSFTSADDKKINVLYISLDNSVRANKQGFPLKNRLFTLTNLIGKIVRQLGETFVCFSEACRSSFTMLGDKKHDLVHWFEIRRMLEETLDLYHLVESKNNECPEGMSMGVAIFCTRAYRPLVADLYAKNLLKPGQGFGSGFAGVKLLSGEIFWAIHYPVDFNSHGVDNLGYCATRELCAVMRQFKGTVLALGDFNLIPGKILDAIRLAVEKEKEFAFLVGEDNMTFYGAFYDQVEKRGEKWESLICDV